MRASGGRLAQVMVTVGKFSNDGRSRAALTLPDDYIEMSKARQAVSAAGLVAAAAGCQARDLDEIAELIRQDELSTRRQVRYMALARWPAWQVGISEPASPPGAADTTRSPGDRGRELLVDNLPDSVHSN